MNLASIYPSYPKDTHVYLKKKKWVLVAKDILQREGVEDVKVFAEPGKWYRWEERYETLVDLFVAKVRELWKKLCGVVPDVTLGSHIVCEDMRTGARTKSIHFATIRPHQHILETIIHEVAHELSPDQGHGESWKKEYRRLKAKYIKNPTVTSDNDQGMHRKL